MILNISPERSFNTLLEYVEKRKTIFYDIIGQNALSIAQRRSEWHTCTCTCIKKKKEKKSVY